MTLEEFNKAIEDLDSYYQNSKNSIEKEFVKSNTNYSVGDILKDKFSDFIIRVINISYYKDYNGIYNGIPKPVYSGMLLKKTLKPTKKTQSIFGEDRCILVKKASEEI